MAHKQVQSQTDDFVFKPVRPGTPEMERLLQVGYPDMTVETANQIIRERAENPQTWPFEELKKAKAFLAAYKTPSRPISTDPGWKREPVYG